jgi:hypothetical protein
MVLSRKLMVLLAIGFFGGQVAWSSSGTAPGLPITDGLGKVLRLLPPSCVGEMLQQALVPASTDDGFSRKAEILSLVNRQMEFVLPLLGNVSFPEERKPRNSWELAQKLSYVQLGQTRVEKQIVQGKSDGTTTTVVQKIPYYEVLLPYAGTGLYFPNGETPDKLVNKVDAVLVVLGGIGFDFSTAKSVVGIAGTFNKVLKGAQDFNPALPLIDGRPLSVLALPMDAPLNGMGESSPFLFGHPKMITDILTHAQMILSWLFPGKPIFFAGRSQGGANVLELASVQNRISGVIALNPSVAIPEVIAHVIQTHSDPDSEIVRSLNLVPHPKSWSGHNLFTTEYTFLERPSRVPSLILTSRNDPSYPQEVYRPALEAFISSDQRLRRLAAFDDIPSAKAHDLWNVENRQVYDQIITLMGNYMIEHGAGKGNRAP